MTSNMILVISEDPSVPSSFVKRQKTNQPELRHTLIYDKLMKHKNINIVHPYKHITNADSDAKLIPLNICNPNLLLFLKNCYLSYYNHTIPDNNEGIVPYNITKSEYKSNFDVLLEKLPYYKQCGIWCDDSLTPIFEDTWENILTSANNSYSVCDFIHTDYQVIYCLNPLPGHHAKYNSYGGYCFLNNTAIVARTLQNNITNIKLAILDIDYHAGNGTAQIFNNDPSVFTISIHANPAFDYPFYESYEFENTETNMNILFEPNTDIHKYMKLLEKATNYINLFDPDYLIIAFGGDTFKNDPDASPECRCGLEITDYKEISRYIRSIYKKKIIICQEGGYDMENIADIVNEFLTGFL